MRAGKRGRRERERATAGAVRARSGGGDEVEAGGLGRGVGLDREGVQLGDLVLELLVDCSVACGGGSRDQRVERHDGTRSGGADLRDGA